MSTNAENLVTIVPVVCWDNRWDMQIFCHLIRKDAFVTLVISGITGPIFIMFVKNVGKIKYFHWINPNQNGDIAVRFRRPLFWMNAYIQIMP